MLIVGDCQQSLYLAYKNSILGEAISKLDVGGFMKRGLLSNECFLDTSQSASSALS